MPAPAKEQQSDGSRLLKVSNKSNAAALASAVALRLQDQQEVQLSVQSQSALKVALYALNLSKAFSQLNYGNELWWRPSMICTRAGAASVTTILLDVHCNTCTSAMQPQQHREQQQWQHQQRQRRQDLTSQVPEQQGSSQYAAYSSDDACAGDGDQQLWSHQCPDAHMLNAAALLHSCSNSATAVAATLLQGVQSGGCSALGNSRQEGQAAASSSLGHSHSTRPPTDSSRSSVEECIFAPVASNQACSTSGRCTTGSTHTLGSNSQHHFVPESVRKHDGIHSTACSNGSGSGAAKSNAHRLASNGATVNSSQSIVRTTVMGGSDSTHSRGTRQLESSALVWQEPCNSDSRGHGGSNSGCRELSWKLYRQLRGHQHAGLVCWSFTGIHTAVKALARARMHLAKAALDLSVSLVVHQSRPSLGQPKSVAYFHFTVALAVAATTVGLQSGHSSVQAADKQQSRHFPEQPSRSNASHNAVHMQQKAVQDVYKTQLYKTQKYIHKRQHHVKQQDMQDVIVRASPIMLGSKACEHDAADMLETDHRNQPCHFQQQQEQLHKKQRQRWPQQPQQSHSAAEVQDATPTTSNAVEGVNDNETAILHHGEHHSVPGWYQQHGQTPALSQPADAAGTDWQHILMTPALQQRTLVPSSLHLQQQLNRRAHEAEMAVALCPQQQQEPTGHVPSSATNHQVQHCWCSQTHAVPCDICTTTLPITSQGDRAALKAVQDACHEGLFSIPV